MRQTFRLVLGFFSTILFGAIALASPVSSTDYYDTAPSLSERCLATYRIVDNFEYKVTPEYVHIERAVIPSRIDVTDDFIYNPALNFKGLAYRKSRSPNVKGAPLLM